MLIERLVLHENKRVVLFAPKAAREGVWEPHLRRWLPHIGGVGGGADFSSLSVFSHTDLGRGNEFPERFQRMTDLADAVIIDEAHHFRNRGSRGDDRDISSNGDEQDRRSRYWRLYDMLDGSARPKLTFLLTATPVNNRLADFRHMAELFTPRRRDLLRPQPRREPPVGPLQRDGARAAGRPRRSRRRQRERRCPHRRSECGHGPRRGPDAGGPRRPGRRRGVRSAGRAAQPVLRQGQPDPGAGRVGRVSRAQAAPRGQVLDPVVVPGRARHVREGLPSPASAVLVGDLLPAGPLHRPRGHQPLRGGPPAPGRGA